METKTNYSGSVMKRRGFIKSAGLAATGLAVAPSIKVMGRRSTDISKVRIGWIGMGSRGIQMLKSALAIEGIEVPAVCDILEERNTLAQRLLVEAGHAKPEAYSRGPEDWKRLLERKDLDAVFCMAPWDLHTPVMVACMKAGLLAGTELPACNGMEEAWELVETFEKTGTPFMMLENYCYMRYAQMILNMVNEGAFGDISHCEVGYQNSSPYIMFNKNGELLWRGKARALHNGNRYPTHGIGPAAQWLNINRGDRFDYLVSMSSRSLGLNHYAKRTLGPDHPFAKKEWPLGDVNTSLIRTYNGVSITLYYDAVLPRPFDCIFRIQGTKGISSGTLNKLYLQDRSPGSRWEDITRYQEEYDHPNWKKYGEKTLKHGHEGSDYLIILDFVQSVRNRSGFPIDVYDAVTWSILTELTETSVNNRSRPVDFPDFTRGRWQTREPLPVKAI